MNEICDNSTHHMYHLKRISWSAVLVGALVGLGLSFLLNLFSIAVGLSLIKTSHDGLVSLAVGGFMGLLLGIIVAMFTAGFTAGYLGRPYSMKRNLGVVYGFTTWCLALILLILLMSHIGHYVTFYSNFITHPTTVAFTDDQGMFTPTPTVTTTTVSRSETVVSTQNVINNLSNSAFILFTLFLVGALASCFGGHYGMTCKTSCHDDGETLHNP